MVRHTAVQRGPGCQAARQFVVSRIDRYLRGSIITRATKANPAKAGDAKPRVLASSATFERHEGPKIAGLPKFCSWQFIVFSVAMEVAGMRFIISRMLVFVCTALCINAVCVGAAGADFVTYDYRGNNFVSIDGEPGVFSTKVVILEKNFDFSSRNQRITFQNKQEKEITTLHRIKRR